MERANKFTCPHCGTPLKSARGVRLGRNIKCVKCGAAFTVRAEDAGAADAAAGVAGSRLGIVLGALLLYLAGGAALGVYCFANNVPKQEPTPGVVSAPSEEAEAAGGGDWTAPTAAAHSTLSAADQRAVDNAVANGVWYLKDNQQADGNWAAGVNYPVGYAALASLALLECGVPATDPVVQKAANLVRQEAPGLGDNGAGTYQRALAIFCLDRLGDKKDEALIQELALDLIGGQTADGGWSYVSPRVDRTKVAQLLKILKDDKQPLADWRQVALNGAAAPAAGTWDNSNTQFAVLGLWVAQRHGVAVDKPIALLEQHFRGTQLPNGPDPTGNNQDLGGSWAYNASKVNSSAWPSMTCSGLLGLAVAHGATKNVLEKKQKPLDDPAIKAGLAMLAREIDKPDDKRGDDLYFLWSLERVGVIYDLAKIDGKDWYAWGRERLLSAQRTDGGWTYNDTVLGTSFALLFLKQANVARDLTSKLELLGEKK